ncbi:PROBABLE MEMBRANE PROTEIN [Mycetocola reblochoni REB411]|uniref:PROBABLE MEMBRANE PROTEIN n=1 Tax=Mycetocola reblochoni REB411 TaxID=1255698 RepID=A0A1R4K667_9MICO|nr:PROBABLE MEMBRANE PROTEIN [Mycetocola reblochoni REB411]
MGRRFAAYGIDAVLAWIVYYAFFYESPWASLLVFAAMNLVFIPTIGGTIGHRLMGMFVTPLRGGYVGLWRPLVRTALLCLLLPALVWDSDQRGFHDKIAGTVLLRR